jgi:pyruvate,orthophosphate dikinase
MPEAAKLLAWAKELEVDNVMAADRDPSGDPTATADGIVRVLIVKGSATLGAIAGAMTTGVETVRVPLDGLVAEGLVELEAGEFRLSTKGESLGRSLIEEDRAGWGIEGALAALDAFHELDLRVKEVVTAWQLRGDSGSQNLNDHTDAAYDAAVLGRLAGVHADALEWISSLREHPAALNRYRLRLERALESASAGDQRFVASPRVDSYHSVWFELHEELILLAGRNRADEAAAGRA